MIALFSISFESHRKSHKSSRSCWKTPSRNIVGLVCFSRVSCAVDIPHYVRLRCKLQRHRPSLLYSDDHSVRFVHGDFVQPQNFGVPIALSERYANSERTLLLFDTCMCVEIVARQK
jgi:hypothetical protein